MPPPSLARVPNVELIRTGSWPISTGQWDVSAADLAAAVAALNCPAIRKPRLKLGHVDPRFNKAGIGGPALDGEPAVGWVDNLRVTDSGQSLVGDYEGVPGWLGAANEHGRRIISSAYPDRSVEGFHDFRCTLGHTHPFVLTGVALLGATPPGIGTLKSLADVAALYGVRASDVPEGAVPVAATISNRTTAAAVGDGNAERLRRYWLAGKGALAIRWGTDGDFKRCVRQMREHAPTMRDPEGYCAELHHEATGMWPGDRRNTHKVAAEADTATDVEEDAVPSPQPSRADRIRQAFNATATESRWIVEIGDSDVIVIDDSDRSLHRVPLTEADGTVQFGAPEPVQMAYVPAGEPVAASRVVFASRDESRPVAAGSEPPSDPDHLPSQGTPPNAPTPQPGESPASDVPYITQPPEPSAPVEPAAEPEPSNNTQEGDDMSLSGVRSRLGLPDDADEAAVLAKLDELKSKAETPPPATEPDPQAVAASAQREEQFAAAIGQIQTLSAELAAVKAEKAAEKKASFFAAAVGQGKIAPADRASWETRYDQAPDLVTEIIGAMAAGTAVPVAAAGYTGDPEPHVTEAEFDGMFPPDALAALAANDAKVG
jgi:hypothetical protein